jgi:hypothetical protein
MSLKPVITPTVRAKDALLTIALAAIVLLALTHHL